MAKSIRSKSKRKARNVRRRDVYAPVEQERLLRLAGKLGTIPQDQVPPEPPKRFSFTAPKDPDHDEKSRDLGLLSFRNEQRKAVALASDSAVMQVEESQTDNNAMDTDMPDSKEILRRKVAPTAKAKAVTGLARKRKGSSRQLGF